MSARKQPVRRVSAAQSKLIAAFVILVCLGAAIALGHVLWHRRGPQAPTPIFAGVTYQAERIASTEEGGGLLHVVTVDLAAPGIELYVTPLDPEAVAQGWQYRLRRIGDVVAKEHLAVAINGDAVHLEIALVVSDGRRSRQRGGDGGGRPRRQSHLGARLSAVV